MASALNPALAYAAGALTILSPCVLPLVPIVLSSAAQRQRFAPLALAAGLVLTFTATGFIVAAFGQALGIDTLIVRAAGAVVLCLAGLVLLVPRLQDLLTRVATPLAAWASGRQSALADKAGLWGQALVGALLGVVWAPCVGPTLGAAVALAAEGKDLGEVALGIRTRHFDGTARHRLCGARCARPMARPADDCRRAGKGCAGCTAAHHRHVHSDRRRPEDRSHGARSLAGTDHGMVDGDLVLASIME